MAEQEQLWTLQVEVEQEARMRDQAGPERTCCDKEQERQWLEDECVVKWERPRTHLIIKNTIKNAIAIIKNTIKNAIVK